MNEYGTTCRSQILGAFDALQHRLGRDVFSPAEVIAEVQRRDGQHADSTIRTHIVSVMCINAPRNHGVRYDDLERVSRGQYRRVRS